MVGFHQLQSGHFYIQIHSFFDTRITGTQRLDFSKRQSCFVHIITRTYRGFRTHNLRNELLLIFHRLPEVGIKCSLGHISEHMNQRILVALSFNTALSLGKIARSPRAIKVMDRHKSILHICTGTHFGGTAKQHSHLTSTHFCKQFFLPNFRIGFVNEGNLLRRNTLSNQFTANIVVNGKSRLFFRKRNRSFQRMKLRIVKITGDTLGNLAARCRFRSADVTKHKLCQLIGFTITPDLHNVGYALVDLGSLLIGEQRVDNSLVKTQLSAIGCDLQHIIDRRIYVTGMNFCGSFRQSGNHILLMLRRLGNHCMILNFWSRKIQLVGSLNISDFLEQRHQFR